MIYLEKNGQDVVAFIPKVYGPDYDDGGWTLDAAFTSGSFPRGAAVGRGSCQRS